MTTATPTASRYTTCTGTRCYGLRIEGAPLTCPRCDGTTLLYPRKPKPPVKRALLRQLADGTIQALSSDGKTVYAVVIGAETSCACFGFVNHGHCYHVADATWRFTAFWQRPAGLATAQPTRCDDCGQSCTDARGCICCQAPKPCTCDACCAVDPEPEPPTAAPARPAACQRALYPDCDCPRCAQVAA